MKTNEETVAKYETLADYFMIKDNDVRSKSELFFSIFHEFFKNVQKSMPVIIEEKKPVVKKKTMKERNRSKGIV